MAVYYPKSLARLVGEFEKLPGIGPKSAQRLAFHVMRVPEDETRALADALLAVKGSIRFCSICHNYSEGDICDICADPRRDHALLCVVAEPRDLIAMEKTNEFRGVYHVLHGVINPLEGVNPDRLRIKDLPPRVAGGKVREVILATNPTVEGDTTSLYLADILKRLGVKVTRIAHGMPVGGDLDYADQATLIQALEWRREL
ncbi:MAG: recombination protein RecR [Armatimonadetes bacterium]|nr:recombination protein RecR [Armatimonadota bacterium]